MERSNLLLKKKIDGTASYEELQELVDELILEKNHESMEDDLNKIVFKCKPVWQFQSIEFEVSATKDNIPEVMDLYSEVLSKLMTIAPEQNKQASPAVKLASEKQKEIMKKFGIKFTAQTTSEEAQNLIKKSIAKEKELDF